MESLFNQSRFEMDRIITQEFKERFEAIVERLQNTDSQIFLQAHKGDEVDRVLSDRENQLQLKLKGRSEFYLKKVGEALQRIEEGTFGYCLECEGQIELSRLYARPVATRCISCKEEQERVEDHIPYQRKSHTLGRTFKGQALTKEMRANS